MMKFSRNKNNAFGIGLLELMAALAIIAAILLMATRYFSQASESNRISEAVSIVRNVTDASFKWLEGQPNFQGTGQPISIETLINSKLLSPRPATCLAGGVPCILDPWGGIVTVKPYGGKSQQIEITLPQVPQSACKNMADTLTDEGIVLQNSDCNGGYIGLYPAQP